MSFMSSSSVFATIHIHFIFSTKIIIFAFCQVETVRMATMMTRCLGRGTKCVDRQDGHKRLKE